MATAIRSGRSAVRRQVTLAHQLYVQDIAQLVRQRHLPPVTIVSHSLGGTIASVFTGAYPDLVTRLVIIEGVGLYPHDEGRPDVRLR